jgi:hypothetical protein
MLERDLRISDDDELYGGALTYTDSSVIRRLALAVLAHAVHEAESNLRGRQVRGNKKYTAVAGIADDAYGWLHNWELVEPWCRTAEISPTRLQKRISQLGNHTNLAA